MKSNFDRVIEINRRKIKILYASTLITLLLTINEKYKFLIYYPDLEVYAQVVIAINLILIVSYLLLDFRATYIYSRAERNRTLEYLDNSFDTNFGGKKVANYFTQSKLNPGFYKLAVNCFENVFHTFYITREMQAKIYGKAITVIILFIFSAAVGDKGIIRSLIEAILPLTLLQDAIKLSYFISRLDKLLDNFKAFFTTLSSTGFANREPEALKYVIEYETTLAWASIPLENKIFYKMKNKLGNEWEELKLLYKIT